MAKRKRVDNSERDVAEVKTTRRNQDRNKSNENAQKKAGWYSDESYMSEVGKEGLKRQQERAAKIADDEDVKNYWSKENKKRVVGSSKTASVGKKPQGKKTARKRVAGK